MKNIKKLITLCGFLVLGSIACGDVDNVKAETTNNQATDTSGYTITIPSDVDIDNDSGKGSFAVSGKAEAQVDLNVSVSSKNNYKLKNKSQEISYSLDKESFHIDNKQSASSKSFDEKFMATVDNLNSSFSGSYEDKLVFDITGNKTEYYLDLNGWLDGASAPNIDGYGTVDIYIEGKIVASGISDFYRKYPYGTNYEIKNIKAAPGHVYNGTFSGHLKGRVTEPSTTLYPSFSAKTYTLTVSPNGGSILDGVTEAQILSPKLIYGKTNWWNIESVKPQRDGYTFNGWYTSPDGGVKIYDADGKCVNDGKYWNEHSYIGLENLTVYAQWSPNIYTIKYNSNGGSGTMGDDSVVFDSIYKTQGNTFTKNKSIFVGWNTEADGTGSWWCIPKWENGIYTPNSLGSDGIYESGKSGIWKIAKDTVLYAQWMPSICHLDLNSILGDTIYYWSHNYGTVDIYVNGKIVADDVSDFSINANYGDTWEIKDFKANNGYLRGRILYKDFGLNQTTLYNGSSGIFHGDLNIYPEWNKIPITTGTVLNIEGNDYIVMGQTEDGNYRLISGTSIGSIQYQPNQDANGNYYNIGQYDENDEQDKRYDGQDSNTYEDSYIDKFLENTWYTSLPSKMQNAIVPTQINQLAYKEIGHGTNFELLPDTDKAATDGQDWYYNEGTVDNPKWVVYYKHKYTETDEGIFPLKVWYKQDVGYSGQKYNTITRHVYLPSLSEVNELVNLNDANKTYAFTQGTKGNAAHVWLRDNSAYSPRWALGISNTYRSLCRHYVSSAWFGVRPSFVIDLSKIDCTVTGTVNYK